ncbi:hypothetical protein WJR50_31195 [Catalinimonas sp. 4WD22]
MAKLLCHSTYYCSGVEKMENSVIAHLNGVEGSDTADDMESG